MLKNDNIIQPLIVIKMSSLKEYELYNHLYQRAIKRNNQSIDITNLCNTIKDISRNQSLDDMNLHYREIAAIILHHYIASQETDLPMYNVNVMTGKKGLLYNMTNFPEILQRILAEYVENPNITE